ncbi:MAG: aminotransferase class IV, partial [Clostridia bacterium]|nr:aminotransferase class IV [Clostridia bacterium]
YWQVSRGTAPRAHVFPADRTSNLLAWAKAKPLGDLRIPMSLITVSDVRYFMCNVKTLNLMPNIIAAQAAKAAGCDEAVFVRDGFVTEGAHTNIHIIKDGCIITHENGPLILPGTVRLQMLRICDRLGIPYIERPFTPDELFSADEVLITSSTSFIRRAASVDGVSVGGRAAAIYESLIGAYEADVALVCGRR